MAVSLQHSDDDLSEISEINVTPFIDVILVLLIIFMVAAPLSTVDIAVDLPVSNAQQQPRPDKPLFVTLKGDLTVTLGEDSVARDALGAALDRATENNHDQRIFLRADRSVPYGELMLAMNLLRDAGYLKVALVGLEDAKNEMRVPTSIGIGALWTTAALAAVAGHAAVAAIALNWTTGDGAPPAAPPVLMISLAPISAPQVPEQQVAPGPQAADSAPQEEQKLPEKVIESEQDLPKLPEKKEEAVAMLPPPMPEPKPQVKPVVRETPVEVKKEEKKKERKLASRAAAPSSFEAPRAAQANATAAGAARVPVAALASWKSDLMAQLNRHKRYPSGSSSNGTATVAFSINRSGEVTSARLARSSGDSALDQEAVSLPKRASPLPKPPEGVGSGAIALSVPIYFGR